MNYYIIDRLKVRSVLNNNLAETLKFGEKPASAKDVCLRKVDSTWILNYTDLLLCERYGADQRGYDMGLRILGRLDECQILSLIRSLNCEIYEDEEQAENRLESLLCEA